MPGQIGRDNAVILTVVIQSRVIRIHRIYFSREIQPAAQGHHKVIQIRNDLFNSPEAIDQESTDCALVQLYFNAVTARLGYSDQSAFGYFHVFIITAVGHIIDVGRGDAVKVFGTLQLIIGFHWYSQINGITGFLTADVDVAGQMTAGG